MARLLERMDRFSPARCRLFARDGRGILSTRKLADRTGLKKSTVHEISLLPSWETVPVGIAIRFAEGCGIDFLSTKRKTYCVKQWNWAFVVRHIHPTQKGFFQKLLTIAATNG